jgi:uncharacterized protein
MLYSRIPHNSEKEVPLMERRITYFEDVRADNTEATFSLVRERLKGSAIEKVVLASTTGATAERAARFFHEDGVKLIVVPHQFDFKRDVNPFPRDLATKLRGDGHEVHFATMLFHTDDFYGSTNPSQMANLLRCFSQGVKVCVEIVVMATDGGHVMRGEQVIAIGGTGRGSDTALVMLAASSQHIKRLRVNEILCKPLSPLNIDEVLETQKR